MIIWFIKNIMWTQEAEKKHVLFEKHCENSVEMKTSDGSFNYCAEDALIPVKEQATLIKEYNKINCSKSIWPDSKLKVKMKHIPRLSNNQEPIEDLRVCFLYSNHD